MKVESYLMFEGRCDEALEFYRRALGAQVTMLMRYKDNPEPAAGEGCADGSGPGPKPEMVMHASFTVGDTQIMASDGMGSGHASFQGISLALSPANAADAQRYFDALADGGKDLYIQQDKFHDQFAADVPTKDAALMAATVLSMSQPADSAASLFSM